MLARLETTAGPPLITCAVNQLHRETAEASYTGFEPVIFSVTGRRGLQTPPIARVLGVD